MDVFLVRHAKAGERKKWEAPDHLRPLSKKGRKQADRLVGLLEDRGVKRIVSSPYIRCVQTVQPLADHLGLEVEGSDALVEGVSPGDVVTLAREVAGAGGNGESAVLCTHGDVIPTLLDTLMETDGLDLPDDYPCAKGATWRLRAEGGRFVESEYLPAPS